MEEVYIYNGKEYTKEQIQAFAYKAGAPSFDAYVSQFGITKKGANSSNEVYSYNGKDYSFDEVNQLAVKAGAPSVQEYVNHFGLKKKENILSSRSLETQLPFTMGGEGGFSPPLPSSGGVGTATNAQSNGKAQSVSESDILKIKKYIQGQNFPQK